MALERITADEIERFITTGVSKPLSDREALVICYRLLKTCIVSGSFTKAELRQCNDAINTLDESIAEVINYRKKNGS